MKIERRSAWKDPAKGADGAPERRVRFEEKRRGHKKEGWSKVIDAEIEKAQRAVVKQKDPEEGKGPSPERGQLKRKRKIPETPFLDERERLVDFDEGKRQEGQRKRQRQATSADDDLTAVGPRLLAFFAEEYPGGYSAAQLARHVAIQVCKSKLLSDCLSWSNQPPRKDSTAQRDLLPLPQWFSSVKVLQRLEQLDVSREEPGEWRERGGARSSTS